MNKAYKAGHFERFGISNYSAQQVEELVSICEKNGWVKPSVYQVSPANPFYVTCIISDRVSILQGQYNAISRGNEDDLFPVLRKHGISFYAYRQVLPILVKCL